MTQVVNDAQITFMHRALRALVRSHPDPRALHDAWREESAAALSSLGIEQVRIDAPADVKGAFERAFWQWEEVVQEAVRRQD